MGKKVVEGIKAVAICFILAFGVAYMCARELDKDAERACGMVPETGRPSDCISWWESNGIKIPDEIRREYSEHNNK